VVVDPHCSDEAVQGKDEVWDPTKTKTCWPCMAQLAFGTRVLALKLVLYGPCSMTGCLVGVCTGFATSVCGRSVPLKQDKDLQSSPIMHQQALQ